MKNNFLNYFESRITIRVKGSNLSRFIKRLNDNKINIYNIKYKYDSVELIILKKHWDLVDSIKTVYEIELVSYHGIYSLKKNLFENKYILFSIIIAFIFIILLTRLIFDVEVITNDSVMRQDILEVLKSSGIKKYSFQKSYQKLQTIKDKIKEKYNDKIEWLEIEKNGTKYIVRYEPRIDQSREEECPLRNVVASKPAVIYDVDARSGVIVRETNSYVKAGEVVISGYVNLNENVKDIVCADGKVLGIVWYLVNITYPLNYYEEKETGNHKKIYAVKIFNKTIELFNFNRYNYKSIKEKILLYNGLLPIYLVSQEQKELQIVDEQNSVEQACERAITAAQEKITNMLSDGEFVLDYEVLSKSNNANTVSLEVFFNVVEDITDYQLVLE